MNALAAVVMNPRTRGVLAIAKQELDMASQRLTSDVGAIDLDNIDAWLSAVEERVAGVRQAIAEGGPYALPQPTSDR